ncbi:MAG: DUF4465 domain-containing protein, partial [Bacteroidota bacterium]
ANDSLDYIVDDWSLVDLTALGAVDQLEFVLYSTDTGVNGINTPTFFAMDNLIIEGALEFEERVATFDETFIGLDEFIDGRDAEASFTSGTAFFENAFSPDFGGFWQGGWALSSRRDSLNANFTDLGAAKTGTGAEGTLQYAVGQQRAEITFPAAAMGESLDGMFITNTTYAYNVIRDGNMFTKPGGFGGETGDDPDFFTLSIYNKTNIGAATDTVLFYLADYRSDNNEEDFIIDDWTFVDLSGLGVVDTLVFEMNSSDSGVNGINTPLFFAIDQFSLGNTVTDVEDVIAPTFSVNVFPNPTTDWINIEKSGPIETSWVGVFDNQGRLIKQDMTQQLPMQLDVRLLPAGAYWLTITSKNQRQTIKFVKQ